MPAERWELRSAPGCVLGKVLGTSATGTTKMSVDLGRWAIFAVWEDGDAHQAFLDSSELFTRWRDSCTSMQSWTLEPVSSRGTWDGVEPFGQTAADTEPAGPIAILTRASIRWSKFITFARAVPRVDAALRRSPGCSMALGIGEWPVGQQATFSTWDGLQSVRAFAHNGEEHSEVVRRTYAENWYSEEMFSRFRVLAHTDTSESVRLEKA